MASPVLVLLLCVLLFPLPTSAQHNPGDLGVFLHPECELPGADFQLFTVRSLYVVAFDPPNGIRSFEFAITGLEDPAFHVVNVELLVAGANTALDSLHFRVETEECLRGSVVPLVRVDILRYKHTANAPICVANVDGEDTLPSYVDCDGTAVDFTLVGGRYPADGCFLVEPHPPYCCPEYTRWTRSLSMPHVVAQPATRATLPLYFDKVTSPCRYDECSLDSASSLSSQKSTPPAPNRSPGPCPYVGTYGLGGTLVFDSSLLDLVGLVLGESVPNWTVVWEPIGPGEIRFIASYSTYAHDLPDLDNDTLLEFEFDVLAPGHAQVVIEQGKWCASIWPEWGEEWLPCNFDGGSMRVVGAITQSGVRTDHMSFGMIKSLFGN